MTNLLIMHLCELNYDGCFQSWILATNKHFDNEK